MGKQNCFLCKYLRNLKFVKEKEFFIFAKEKFSARVRLKNIVNLY